MSALMEQVISDIMDLTEEEQKELLSWIKRGLGHVSNTQSIKKEDT